MADFFKKVKENLEKVILCLIFESQGQVQEWGGLCKWTSVQIYYICLMGQTVLF